MLSLDGVKTVVDAPWAAVTEGGAGVEAGWAVEFCAPGPEEGGFWGTVDGGGMDALDTEAAP